MGQVRFRPHQLLRITKGSTTIAPPLVAPLDSRTKRRYRRARFSSFRHLPSPPSGLPGDGDGGELRRRIRPPVCLGQVGELPPGGARPRPSPLRLPPRRWLVGPFQSPADGAGGGRHLGAQLRPPFSTRNTGFQVTIEAKSR